MDEKQGNRQLKPTSTRLNMVVFTEKCQNIAPLPVEFVFAA
jgi:hypothetical protein